MVIPRNPKGDNVNMSSSLFWGPRVRLAAPRPEDDAIIAGWTHDDAYLRLVDTDIARPRALANVSEGSPPLFEFRIRRRPDDALVGFIALMGIEWGNRIGKLAVGIGDPQHRGQGYGVEAMTLILNYAFRELNLHRVGLDVIAYNAAAIHLYEKVGFQHEGRVREWVWRDGVRTDLLLMGLLARDWLARTEAPSV